MIPTTEQLLATPAGFDLATATPVQRARCRIGDGIPLGELRHDPDVVDTVGGPEALEALPSEQGIAPDVVVDLSSIRSAKTMMAVCRAVRGVFAVDVDGIRIGEIPRVALFSLKLGRARVAFRMLSALFSRPALRPLVISETAESITVRHPSGSPIEIVCAAGGRAAQDFVGDWLAGVVADEAPRMLGRQDGVVNLDDVLTAVRGRVLKGGQIQLIGSPWAPHGPVYDLVAEHGAKPSKHVVVLRSTGPQNNPGHWTPERCAELEQTDPVAFATSVQAEFADPESGLLSPISVRTNTRAEPLELPPERGASYAAAVDVGKGRWTLCIVEAYEAVEDKLAYFRVALAREFLGTDPTGPWGQIAATCQRYGIKTASVDQYAASESNAIAKRYGLQLRERPWNAGNKLEAFTDLATLVHAGRVEFPPDRAFRRDMLAVKKRTTATGYTIHLPHTSDGRHCDFAPALAAAVKQSATKLRSGSVRIFFSAPSERSYHTSSRQRGHDYSLPPEERFRRFITQE